MNWEAIGAVGEFTGAIAVVASLIYLAIQVRQSKASSEREAAFEMIRSFQTDEFSTMLLLSFEVPPGLTGRELEERLGDDMQKLFSYMATWESLGILVHRGQISLDLVCDFFSHAVLAAWEMTETYVLELRKQAGRDTPWEWFQWLADRVKLAESTKEPIPAFIEFDDWGRSLDSATNGNPLPNAKRISDWTQRINIR